MESPVTVVKSAIQPGKLIAMFVGFIVIAAIAEVTGFTSFLLAPVSTIKAKLGK